MTKQRPPLNRWQVIAIGAVGVLLAVIITLGAISEGNAPTTPTTAATEASAEPEPAASEPEPGSEPVEPEPDEVLTVENNEDLAALLVAVEDFELYEEFATKYQGRIIEFDGIIAALNQHGDYETRYDILIFAGNSIESGVRGPNFQFNDVNIVNDLRLTGLNIPDTPGVGQKLRITAEVESYAGGFADLLLLDPVSTEVRQ